MTLCRSCLLYKMSKASLQFWIEKKFQQNSHRKTHSKANKTMKHFQQNHTVAVNPLIYIVCYLNIYLVCYLSNLSQRRYIYCIYLYPQGFHAPILCTLQLQLLACAALADCLPSAITCQAKKNTQEDITDHITCFLLNSSMITSVLPLARDREDGGSNAPNNVPLSHIHRVTLAVIRNRKSMCN